MYSIEFKCFHNLWVSGLEYLSKLLVAHVKGLDGRRSTKSLWGELKDITEDITECELDTVPDPADADRQVEYFLETLSKME